MTGVWIGDMLLHINSVSKKRRDIEQLPWLQVQLLASKLRVQMKNPITTDLAVIQQNEYLK